MAQRIRPAVGFLLLMILISLLLPAQTAWGQSDSPQAAVITLNGAITPVMVSYLERGLNVAEQRGTSLVIVQLDTPGGSITLMNEMIKLIRQSPIPVVVYVSPQGSMAASAGTMITLAGSLAAMAPDTIIGAASPVGSQGEDIGTTMERKEKDALKATARNLTAGRRPEAVQLAQETIENARAVTVDEALAVGMVDIKATDLNDLLSQLDGRTVKAAGENITLNTAGMQTRPVRTTIIEEWLSLLTNPNLVFLLLSIGVQAVLIEMSSPGGWVAGFIGAICLLLAIYALGLLPVNWFGLLFLVIAFVLFVVDIKAPTHGALTAAGVGSFIIGALVLFNTIRLPGTPQQPAPAPGTPQLSVPLVITTGVLIGLSFFAIVTLAVRAQHTPLRMGRETLVGKRGFVRQALNPRGQVQIAGETWTAEPTDESSEPLPVGAEVIVDRVEGLRLKVHKAA